MMEINSSLLEIALKAVKNGICYEYLNACMGFDRVYLDYKEEYGGYVLISKYLDYADFIENHINYLNKKFNSYFKFCYDKTVAYKVRGSMGVFDTIEATFTIYCEKIYL